METPPELEAAAGETTDITIANREYDNKSVIAVDFGATDETPTVDVVGDTAIVTVGSEQFEFAVPADASDVTVNGGILTISG